MATMHALFYAPCASFPSEQALTMAASKTWAFSGVPRSGTSLVCKLAGELPNTVALSEPMDGRVLKGISSNHEACANIQEFMDQTRQRILRDRRAPSLHDAAGRLMDNVVGVKAADGDSGLRTRQDERGDIDIDKPLTSEFTLLVKHNALFAALLKSLRNTFSCLALVRNPLAVLASWQTVALPVQRGRIPVGERLDQHLAHALDAEPSTLRRQVAVLDWFFEQYETHLPASAILRYEELIASCGEALFYALGVSGAPRPPALTSQNANPVYDADSTQRLLSALLEGRRTWRFLYSHVQCEEAADAIAAGGEP